MQPIFPDVISISSFRLAPLLIIMWMRMWKYYHHYRHRHRHRHRHHYYYNHYYYYYNCHYYYHYHYVIWYFTSEWHCYQNSEMDLGASYYTGITISCNYVYWFSHCQYMLHCFVLISHPPIDVTSPLTSWETISTCIDNQSGLSRLFIAANPLE